MVIENQAPGAPRETRLSWSSDIRGFRGVERSLAGQPLAPGQKRTLRMLMPLVNQVAEIELSARDFESTAVMGVERNLLAIDSRTRLPDGNSLSETLWSDPAGNVLKHRLEGIGQESYRTRKEVALSDVPNARPVDLGVDTLIKVDPPLEKAHRARQIRYRVELANGDPAKVFSNGPTQSVRSLDAHAAELTVRGIRPGDRSEKRADKGAAVGGEYLAANTVLQIDNPLIRQMATEARGAQTEGVKVALALESYVHRLLVITDFSQAFATAAEVAQSRRGDCTEHAVLLAALARASGIPARVAIGLVYVEHAAAFGYHMWTEVYLDGQWVGLDATLGLGGIGAAHLKLADSSLEGATAYSAFLPVAQVVGQLKIKVIDAVGE
jgi:hypothetical protein